jgi:hypothetical protein
MRRLIEAALLSIAFLILLSRVSVPLPVHAEPLSEETRKLLEKSLSVVEIDREIGRISVLSKETQVKIADSQQELSRQELEIAVHREKAGRVLRSYYMGRQDLVLSAFLNAHSLGEFLRTWEAVQIVLQSDSDALNRFTKAYKSLREGYQRLRQDQSELTQVENNLRAQRERLLSLQAEVNRALASSGDEARLRQLMTEMEAYWKNIGLYEVRRHFRALSEAMQALPDWIRDHPETLERNGLKATVTITDTQLNEFLRSRSDDFKHFAIRFESGRMMLTGNTGDLSVIIGGRYTIQEEPENAIRFHVDSLTFNGLNLPDTTRADLEREFDLGFYPQMLIPFLKAQSVTLDPGKLIVQLKIG